MDINVIFNEHYKREDLKTKLNASSDKIIIENSKNKKIDINISDIKKMELLYDKCPTKFLRNIPIFIELFTIVFIVLAILFRTSRVLCILFICLTFVNILVSGIIAKIIYKFSKEALELNIIASKKYSVIGYNAKEQLFNKLQRILNEFKENNQTIEINIQRQRNKTL